MKTIIFALALLFFSFTSLFSQTNTPHEISVGYGLFSFNGVHNPGLYESVNSIGIFTGRYMYNLNEKFAIGLEYNYEHLKPTVQGMISNDSLFRTSNYYFGKLRMVLYEKNKFKLYVSASAGVVKVDQNLPYEEEQYKEIVKEFVLVGLSYSIIPRTLFYGELTTGQIALIKTGISLKF
jgi:hypothetical protein